MVNINVCLDNSSLCTFYYNNNTEIVKAILWVRTPLKAINYLHFPVPVYKAQFVNSNVLTLRSLRLSGFALESVKLLIIICVFFTDLPFIES